MFSERVWRLPYLGHIRDDVILLRGGGVMAMGKLHGPPFHLAAHRSRNNDHQQHNAAMMAIADPALTLVEHLVRHDGIVPEPEIEHRSAYAQHLYRDFRAARGRLRVNEWFVSLILHPTVPGLQASVETLNDKMATYLSGLAHCQPQRLGVREAGGVPFSEIAEALRLILTTKWLAVPMAEDLDGVYTDRAVCGPKGIEIQAPVPHYAYMSGLKTYMRRPRVGMFNTLLEAACRLVMTNSFEFYGLNKAMDSLSLTTRRLLSADDATAAETAEELDQARADLSNGAYAMGLHHFSLAVHADRFDDMQTAARDVRSALPAASLAAEGRFGGERSYHAQLSGHRAHRTRPGVISTANFARFSSLDNALAGSLDAYWKPQPAPVRLKTREGTAFDFSLHVGDVPHAAAFGPNGSGKTLWMQFLIAMYNAIVGGTGGTQILLDRDNASEISIRALGGRYVTLRLGATGMAPVKRLDNSRRARAWLHEFLVGLILSDGQGPMLPAETEGLSRGIDFMMDLPPAERSLDGIRQFIGFDRDKGAGAGERFQQWCRGGARGWVFDNDEDVLDLDTGLIGIDGTELMDDPLICGPMAAYLLFLTGGIIDGRRVIVWIDEFVSFLPDPLFVEGFKRWALRMRKKNAAMVIATQQPEHIIDHPIGASILGQVKTYFLFRNPDASPTAYCGGDGVPLSLNCTPGEFRAVTQDMLVGERSLLIKRDGGSVLCRFDLSALPQHIAVLSGRSKTIDLFRACGGDLQEFWRRLSEAKA